MIASRCLLHGAMQFVDQFDMANAEPDSAAAQPVKSFRRLNVYDDYDG